MQTTTRPPRWWASFARFPAASALVLVLAAAAWALRSGRLAAYAAVGGAVDLDNRKIWFRLAPSGNWNASGTANPATNTGGYTIPAGTMVPFVTFGGTAGTAGHALTANFGASVFSGAVPAGFTSGWPA